MVDIVIASVILIVLFGIIFRRRYQSYYAGRFLILTLYFLVGVSFAALAFGIVVQVLKIEAVWG
jgi:uncharacterized membrane protein